jgi:hypothetical protein
VICALGEICFATFSAAIFTLAPLGKRLMPRAVSTSWRIWPACDVPGSTELDSVAVAKLSGLVAIAAGRAAAEALASAPPAACVRDPTSGTASAATATTSTAIITALFIFIFYPSPK